MKYNRKTNSRFSKIFNKLKTILFSRHYVIERFGINFSIFAGLLLIVFGVAAKAYYDSENIKLANAAKYTQSITTSKTGDTAKIINIYSNARHTKAFVLFKFEDVNKIPLNAKNYQFFMCGTDPKFNYKPISGKPAGSFYVFGSSGYMGVYLVNNQGFPSQMLNLVGRINKQITNDNTDASSDDTNDVSFKKYDQFRIIFNPGARHTVHLKALEGSSEPSVSELYSEMILDKQEKQVKKKLNQDLEQMQIDLNNIQDRKHRLDTYDKLRVPKPPKYIQDDSVIYRKGKYYLNTKQVPKGALNLDWQNITIQEGFISSAFKQVGFKDINNDNLDSNLDKLSSMQSNLLSNVGSSDDSYYATALDDSAWKYKNGKTLDQVDNDDSDSDSDDNSGMISKQTQVSNDITNLEKAWSQYISDKMNYQTTDQMQLLQIENTYRSINSFSAINDSKTAVKLF